MPFRIRDPENDDPAAFKSAEKQYREHLSHYLKTSNRDLWKFFYWDFFHDGWINSIELSPDLQTVSLKITCPNIKRRIGEDDYEYINLNFTCCFSGLLQFRIDSDISLLRRPPNGDPGIFRYAEINSYPGLADIKSEDESFYSLLIDLEVNGSKSCMELVFQQVDVASAEPAAFSLMEASSQFSMPTYDSKTEV
jgi:hypothetical protein